MLVRIWRKEDPCALLVGMYIGGTIVEPSVELSQETNIRTTI